MAMAISKINSNFNTNANINSNSMAIKKFYDLTQNSIFTKWY